MKIRQGFVSNSSSSSFIIAGVRIESDVWENFSDDLRDKLEEDHRVLFGSDDGLDDDDVIVGTMLADGGECGLDYEHIDVAEIVTAIKDAAVAVGIDNVKQDGVFTGTRCC